MLRHRQMSELEEKREEALNVTIKSAIDELLNFDEHISEAKIRATV